MVYHASVAGDGDGSINGNKNHGDYNVSVVYSLINIARATRPAKVK